MFIQWAARTNLENTDTENHHFYPYARLTEHAPESNEGDYAFYLPAVHKKTGQKTHDTHGR